MEHGRYYQHSGQFSLGGLILGSIAASAGVVIAAAIYAAAVLYIPLAGVITFVLAVGFGVAAGFVSGAALRWGKLRNGGLAFLFSAAFALEALYVSWVVWVWLLLNRSDVEADLMAILPEPGVLWTVMGEINQTGAWSLSGFTPSGVVLWVLWGFEAILIFAPALFMSLGMVAVPFCERCDRWCDVVKDVARLRYCDGSTLRQNLDGRPAEFLASLGAPSDGDEKWIRADFHECSSCKGMHALTLSEIAVSTDEKGERSEIATETVRQLLVTSADAAAIRGLGPTAG